MKARTSSSSSTSSALGCITPADNGAYLRLKVTPGASNDAIGGLDDETLKVRLRARAVEGGANRALLNLLSETLGIRKSAFAISKGLKSREKTVHIHGMTPEALKRALAEVLP
jgi:uncharacterized protein (TIGR00251 family)